MAGAREWATAALEGGSSEGTGVVDDGVEGGGGDGGGGGGGEWAGRSAG